MFIDIHAHAFRKPFFQLAGRRPWPNPDQLIEFYDQHEIEKAVLHPLIGPEFYLPQSNEDILEAAERFPGRFIPFCNVHPRAMWNDPFTKLEEVFKQYRDAGCKGVGEVICNMSFFDPFMTNLFRAIEVMEWPMTIHLAHRYGRCYGIYDEPGLPGLDETLSRFPGMKVFAHSQTFWAEISQLSMPYERAGYPTGKVVEGAVPKLFRKFPNLYGDLSAGSGCNALTRDEEYAVKFLNEFQDRLCFGTDICYAKQELPLAGFLIDLKKSGRISEEVFEKIARGNIKRLLNI
jgi:predicted TIM-barrel fold metal-dependent hydrolase